MKKQKTDKSMISGKHRLEQLHLEPASGLPLPDPFPDYLACPDCGEPAIEVWCYQTRVSCHNCGRWIDHTPPSNCAGSSLCNHRKNAKKAEHIPPSL